MFEARIEPRLVITGGKLTKPWLPDFVEKDGRKYIKMWRRDAGFASFCGLGNHKRKPWDGNQFHAVLRNLRNAAVDAFIADKRAQDDPMADEAAAADQVATAGSSRERMQLGVPEVITMTCPRFELRGQEYPARDMAALSEPTRRDDAGVHIEMTESNIAYLAALAVSKPKPQKTPKKNKGRSSKKSRIERGDEDLIIERVRELNATGNTDYKYAIGKGYVWSHAVVEGRKKHKSVQLKGGDLSAVDAAHALLARRIARAEGTGGSSSASAGAESSSHAIKPESSGQSGSPPQDAGDVVSDGNDPEWLTRLVQPDSPQHQGVAAPEQHGNDNVGDVGVVQDGGDVD